MNQHPYRPMPARPRLCIDVVFVNGESLWPRRIVAALALSFPACGVLAILGWDFMSRLPVSVFLCFLGMFLASLRVVRFPATELVSVGGFRDAVEHGEMVFDEDLEQWRETSLSERSVRSMEKWGR